MNHSARLQQIYHTAAVTRATKVKTGVVEEAVGVHLLIPRHEVLLSLWAIKSFYHYSEATYPLTIHCQGDFPSEEIELLEGHFPTAKIVTEAEASQQVEEILESQSLETLLAFRRRDFLFRKVLDFSLLSDTSHVLSFDSDVLFFNAPRELMIPEGTSEKHCWFQRDCFESYQISEKAAKSDLGIELVPKLNSGLMLRSRDWAPLPLLEEIAQHRAFAEPHWHNEQTLQALAACSLGIAKTFPSSYYLGMEPAAKPRKMIARHYCTPVRNDFDAEGVRLLEESGFIDQISREVGASRSVPTLPNHPRSVISRWFGIHSKRKESPGHERRLTFPMEAESASINSVYLTVAPHEVWMARLCVSSVRFWHPDIRITLVKDLSHGDFDLSAFESDWGCTIESPGHGQYGYGLGLIDILTKPKREKIFFLDPDILLAGPLLNLFQSCPMDFVLSVFRDRNILDPAIYYDEQILKEFDPEFSYPGYFFNTGQMVATTGILTREDFADYMDFGEPFKVKDTRVFPCVDQSLLNYLIPREEKKGRLGVSKLSFVRWGWKDLDKINYFRWREGIGYPYLIHWAGEKPSEVSKMNGSHLWKFFEYYDQNRVVPPQRLMEEWFEKRYTELRA